jgi:hypothetical protein
MYAPRILLFDSENPEQKSDSTVEPLTAQGQA